VLVQPTSGTTLSTDAVQAIVHLVASSVPNMTPDSVTVADSSGNVLNAPGMDLSSGQGLEQQTSFDTNLSTAVSTFLATALGPNHADVHVQSDMNFDQKKTTSVTNTAPSGTNGKPLPSQQNETSENFKGPASGGTNGVLGVTQPAPGAATGNGNETYSKTSNQNQNALDTVESEVQAAPGTINRLSVAVLLDSSVVKPADVASWTKQIEAAVGFNAKRGDVVQVTPVPFSKAAAKAAKQQLSAASGSGSGMMLDLVRNIVTLLIVALVLFFAWRAIKRAEANRVPLRVPLDLRELEAADTRALEAVNSMPRLAESERRALAPAAAESGLEGELTDLIEQQPDEVAQTLRSWLADRRT
jgi:flagellar M-ring protein FliF